METITLYKSDDGPCRLADCPPGLFLFDGSIGFKRYGATEQYYCADTGEYFWGGTSSRDEMLELMVTPLLSHRQVE